MSEMLPLVEPKVTPPLGPEFRPLALANQAFRRRVRQSGKAVPLRIAVERGDGALSVYETECWAPGAAEAGQNLAYAERLVKSLLWVCGGWRVVVGGPAAVGRHIRRLYAHEGARIFDADLMGGVYERPFTVDVVHADRVPEARETAVPIGRHLDGCRVGFDAGASDRKVAAVVEGEAVFSEETPWDPRHQSDPQYHHDGIAESIRRAAEHMPRVDAIGVSAAGIYIRNRVRVASLFRGVPKDAFEAKVAGLFLRIQEEWGGVPLEVANDGDVTALAGSMSLNANSLLGIAMGSSEAGGWVNQDGNIVGWLNELAFVPVDLDPGGPVDEWSGDRGCGVSYFSQVGVTRLAPRAGIELDPSRTPAEQLEDVQDLLEKGDERARRVLETIGVYLGYGLGHYADFYDLQHVLVLGRVTSGEGGAIMVGKAQEVLRAEWPELAQRVELHLPDEASRRVGQAIAAASLPRIGSQGTAAATDEHR
jgi:predicted NBD/HSP70 family sugar kinase